MLLKASPNTHISHLETDLSDIEDAVFPYTIHVVIVWRLQLQIYKLISVISIHYNVNLADQTQDSRSMRIANPPQRKIAVI